MTRLQLEHLIRAASGIANDADIVVIGSQALPPQGSAAHVADLFPRNYPERSQLIETTIGEGSLFHTTYGYFARAIDPAVLPAGWEARLVRAENPRHGGTRCYFLESAG